MNCGNTQSKFLSSDVSCRPARPRKTIVAVCLAVSIALHVTAISLVVLASAQRTQMAAVEYIDLKNIVAPSPPAPPMLQSEPSQREHVAPDEPLPAQPETPLEPPRSAVAEIQTTALGRGMAHGYFSSFAEGKTLRDDLREYYLTLLEKINERWWVTSETLSESAVYDAAVVFVIGREGEIMDLRIRKSSGSREVDRAIAETLKEMAPFPQLPASYTFDSFLVPLKIAAPLRLFRAAAPGK